MIALRLRFAQRSRIWIASRFCCSTGSPGLLGQLMLPTVATHAARSARGALGAAGPLRLADSDGLCALGCARLDVHEPREMTRQTAMEWTIFMVCRMVVTCEGRS